MSQNNHSLRVALVYGGTVYQERAFTQTSDPVITLGETEANDFVAPEGAFNESFEMFEREEGGYKIRLPEHLEGRIHVGDDEYSLDEFIDEFGVQAGSADTDEGRKTVYEATVERSDWGLVRLGELEVYFQVMDEPAAIAGRGAGAFDLPVLGTVALAATAHIVFLLMCFLAFDLNPRLEKRKIPDRFVDIMVKDVEDPLKQEKQDDPQEDTTGKKAGGKEGKFGKKDPKQEESKVPKVDGPMKKKVDVKNLGVNKMLASKNLGSGPLKNIFGNQDGFSNKMTAAMSGEGNQLQVGRGAGGMGLRGTGSGGGGEGFGRVHGLGKVDTGGGKGTGAKIGQKKEREVKANVDRGSPNVGDFCDKKNIRTVVSQKGSAIQYCYEKQLQMNPNLQGKMVAQWKVGLQGQVKTASVASSTLNNSKVESCILRVVKRMRFKKPDGGICIINYPFVFSGGG